MKRLLPTPRAIFMLAAAALAAPAFAQSGAPRPPVSTAVPTLDNAVLLTVFLRHDQSRPLAELNAQVEKQGFFKAFPPVGVEVISWTVAMGIGQVIVLKLPATRVREINRIFEDTAWGPYKTEFYLTYDIREIALAAANKAKQP